MKIKICDVDLNLEHDITTAEGADALDKRLISFSEEIAQIESEKGASQSLIIKNEIASCKKLLDDCCGAGSGKAVFEGRENLKTVYITSYVMQNISRLYMPVVLTEALAEELKAYSPKRAERHA